MKIHSVDVFTFKNWVDSQEAIIIDVREIAEYENDHIEGAINIPLSQLLSDIDKVTISSNKKVILQCRIGVRSMNACNMLFEHGFKHDVYNLEGGINAWRNSGF